MRALALRSAHQFTASIALNDESAAAINAHGRVSAPLIRNLFIYRDRALAFDLRASTRDNVRSRSLRRARALLRLFRALNYLRTMTRSRTVRPRSVLAFRECASNGFHFFSKKKGERVRLMKFNEAEVCLTKAEQPGFR